jgi:hypothetical protein
MLKIYVAGKVSKESVFGTHYWRGNFCKELAKLSGLEIHNLDPVDLEVDQGNPQQIFGGDCHLISQSDVLIVYLSDDISVGGSQEILIAKYFKIPVIGLAPHGGKFNGSTKEFFGKVITNYKDPFVFSTCDVVCATVEEVAETLKKLKAIKPKTLDIIPKAIKLYINNKA